MTSITEVQNKVFVPTEQSQKIASVNQTDSSSVFIRDEKILGTSIAPDSTSGNGANVVDNNSTEEKKGNIFQRIGNAIKKHPLLAIATAALVIFAGVKLYKYFSNSANTIAETATTAATPVAETVQKAAAAAPIDAIPKDFESVNKIIGEGLEYERSVHFRNLEIFQNVSDKERELMLTYFRATNKEKELLLFASGNKPAMIEGIEYLNYDIFDALRSSKVNVAELLTKTEGNLIMNKDAACKVIQENLTFFQSRLGMSSSTTVEEVYKCISKTSSNPLRDASAYADLRGLLLGHAKYDAYHTQLVADLRKSCTEGFYSVYRGDLESYKKALKKLITSEKYTYGSMSSGFKADLIKKVESLTPDAFRRFIIEPVHVFPDAAYEKQQLEALRNLASKLTQAQKTNAIIGF